MTTVSEKQMSAEILPAAPELERRKLAITPARKK